MTGHIQKKEVKCEGVLSKLQRGCVINWSNRCDLSNLQTRDLVCKSFTAFYFSIYKECLKSWNFFRISFLLLFMSWFDFIFCKTSKKPNSICQSLYLAIRWFKPNRDVPKYLKNFATQIFPISIPTKTSLSEKIWKNFDI